MEENSAPRLYFAYGSNLDLEQMRRRCPGSHMVGTANLPGFQLAFVGYSESRGGGVATVRKNGNGSHVPGVLYQMTQEDWQKMDGFEGFPTIYRREVVQVINRSGWAVEAETYIRNHGEHRLPSPSYRRIVEAGYRKHNLPRGPSEDVRESHRKRRE